MKEYLQYLVSLLLFNLFEQTSGGKLDQLSLFGAHHVCLSPSRLSILRSNLFSPSGKVEGEPPRKKRRSKWDIHPEDLPTPPVAAGNHETTPPQPPTSAAAAVAAKLNAKLASEGKLKPASAVYMVSCGSVSVSNKYLFYGSQSTVR